MNVNAVSPNTSELTTIETGWLSLWSKRTQSMSSKPEVTGSNASAGLKNSTGRGSSLVTPGPLMLITNGSSVSGSKISRGSTVTDSAVWPKNPEPKKNGRSVDAGGGTQNSRFSSPLKLPLYAKGSSIRLPEPMPQKNGRCTPTP